MPSIVWDNLGDRVYNTGLDKGVLYLPDGSAVPWNGLTSIVEHINKDTSEIYYDGKKISDFVTLGNFTATMRALTYPNEFSSIEGISELRPGFYAANQTPQTFALCYRTYFGNELEGDLTGYKIHIIYNLTATPSDISNSSMTASPNLAEFEWSITAVPEEFPGISPTAHFIINSNDIDPWLLKEIEDMLYGSNINSPTLVPMNTLVSYITNWARLSIVDNGNGTWTASSNYPGFIDMLSNTEFQISNANAVYLNDYTYQISNVNNPADLALIKITDNGDGTWVASSDDPDMFSVDSNGMFTIRNANAAIIDANTYSISDTVA